LVVFLVHLRVEGYVEISVYNIGLINRKVPSLVLECQIGTRF